MVVTFVNAVEKTVIKSIECLPEVVYAIENNSDVVLVDDIEYKFQKKIFDTNNSSFIFMMRKQDKTKIPDAVRNQVVQEVDKVIKSEIKFFDGLDYSIYKKACEIKKSQGKLSAIKFIKEESGWGLKESKEYADRNL